MRQSNLNQKVGKCVRSLLFASSLLAIPHLRALDNGLARTPPMGWNTWNKFACNVSEKLVKEAANAIVSSGMKGAGYKYVVIDDCWQVSRDEAGNIVPDAERFPSGIKAVADYIHSKGLLFGIYSDAGTETCQHRPGSRGYEFQDARQYAAWDVDYLKFDWCSHSTQDSQASYSLMRDALAKSGRPIVFSICEWGSTKPWLWAGNVGNLWRSTGDIINKWDGKEKWGGNGIVQILDLEDGLESYAGPGHWNDPDMLEVGNGALNRNESRAHFSMWCLLAAPLMAGNDIRNMTPETRDILTDAEAIAIDQDPLGQQGKRVRKGNNGLEVWSKQLADGGRAVALLNRSGSEANISASWTEIGYPDTLAASVRDVWAKKDLGSLKGKVSVSVPSHGVVLLRIKP